MEIDTQETVQECLELLRHGSSVEECLALYPDVAEELEPILRSAVSIRATLQTGLPSSTRTRIKDRVLTEWDRQRQPKRRDWRLPSIFPKLAIFPRAAFVAASLIVVLVLAGFGTNTASANTVPGDVLYPVKEFRESVQLWFARSPEAKVEHYTNLVKERVAEVRKIAAKKQADLDAISDALARMEGHLTALNVVVQSKLTDRVENDIDIRFVAAVQRSMDEQGAAGDRLAAALDDVPADARLGFNDALTAIGLARDRVDAALEAVGIPGFGD